MRLFADNQRCNAGLIPEPVIIRIRGRYENKQPKYNYDAYVSIMLLVFPLWTGTSGYVNLTAAKYFFFLWSAVIYISLCLSPRFYALLAVALPAEALSEEERTPPKEASSARAF
jgi:hypothetical protein